MGIFCLAPSSKYDARDQNAELQKLHLELEATRKQLEDRTKSELQLKRELSKLHEKQAARPLEARAGSGSYLDNSQPGLPARIKPTTSSDATDSDVVKKYQNSLKKIEELVEENTSLKDGVAKKAAELQHNVDVLRNVLKEKQELSSKLSTATTELNQLKDSHKLLSESLANHKKLQQQWQELSAQLSTAKTWQAELQAENEELKASVRAAQTINDSTVSSTSKLMTDYSSLQARHSQVQNELKAKDEMLALLQQQLSEIAEDAENEERSAQDQYLFRTVTLPGRGRDTPLMGHNSIT